MKRGRKSIGDKLVVVPITGSRMEPPGDLSISESDEWRGIVDSLPASYFRPSDIPLLSAFCAASALHKQAKKDVAKNGIMIKSADGGKCMNPCLRIMNEQSSVMAQLSVKLRLCPSSRYSTKSAATKTESVGVEKRPWSA